jgi:hypothetical protein
MKPSGFRVAPEEGVGVHPGARSKEREIASMRPMPHAFADDRQPMPQSRTANAPVVAAFVAHYPVRSVNALLPAEAQSAAFPTAASPTDTSRSQRKASR